MKNRESPRFAHPKAGEWMPGIDGVRPVAAGSLDAGRCLRLTSRGEERETRVTAPDSGREIELTSTRGGVTATYTYTLAPAGHRAEIAFHADCRATGLWKLPHPMIVDAMRKSGWPQLAHLRAALEQHT